MRNIGAAIEPCYVELGKWLKSKRAEFGLSQLDTSVILGLSRPSIANIEAGKQRLLYHQVLEMQRLMVPEHIDEYRDAYLSDREDEILAQAERIKARRAAIEGSDGLDTGRLGALHIQRKRMKDEHKEGK